MNSDQKTTSEDFYFKHSPAAGAFGDFIDFWHKCVFILKKVL